MSRSACIDIGSNTTRLLVAEHGDDGLREILVERTFTRLLSGGGPGAPLDPERIADVASTVARQVALAEELEAGNLRVVATAAVRAASTADRTALGRAVLTTAGVPLEVLDEREEARLAFLGAVGTLTPAPDGRLAVVDAGGGSTELVTGTTVGGVDWSVSLPLGSATVTAELLGPDPVCEAGIARARAALEQRFAGVRAPGPVTAYAVGGGATSLYRLVGAVLGAGELETALRLLTGRQPEDVAGSLGLHVERARLLPAALLILEAAVRALGAPLRMAGGGLREGVVLAMLDRE